MGVPKAYAGRNGRGYVTRMLETAQDYYARLLAATDGEGRLPALTEDALSGWDIFPYEQDSLVVRSLAPLSDVEAPRWGEDPRQCWCADPGSAVERAVWRNERWVVVPETESPVLPVWLVLMPLDHHDLGDLPPDLAAELGVLVVALTAAVESLPSVGRAHVNKWGDGGAHLHLQFLGRPARVGQLRGSCLPDWVEHLPPVPDGVVRENLAEVMDRFVATIGGQVQRSGPGSPFSAPASSDTPTDR